MKIKRNSKSILITADLISKLGKTDSFWHRLRKNGLGPSYLKVGRTYTYERKLVKAWLKDSVGRLYFEGVKFE